MLLMSHDIMRLTFLFSTITNDWGFDVGGKFEQLATSLCQGFFCVYVMSSNWSSC